MNTHLSDPRRHGLITASKAWAAVYERHDYWRDMTMRQPPFEGNEMTAWGTDHEPIALSHFEQKMEDICEPGNIFMVHPTLPFGASPDGFLDGHPIEIKCPYSQTLYPVIPERYWFQIQMQLEVCDKDYGWFYCWTPQDSYIQNIPRDRDFMKWYIPLALEFLEYVKSDTEPKRWGRKPIYKKEKQNG